MTSLFVKIANIDWDPFPSNLKYTAVPYATLSPCVPLTPDRDSILASPAHPREVPSVPDGTIVQQPYI